MCLCASVDFACLLEEKKPRREEKSSMAKRTPRSDANDTTNTASAPRQPRQSTAARPESGEGPSRDTAPENLNQSDPMGFQPSEEEIRYRAYLLYVERGGGHGMDFEDWLQAERELKAGR